MIEPTGLVCIRCNGVIFSDQAHSCSGPSRDHSTAKHDGCRYVHPSSPCVYCGELVNGGPWTFAEHAGVEGLAHSACYRRAEGG